MNFYSNCFIYVCVFLLSLFILGFSLVSILVDVGEKVDCMLDIGFLFKFDIEYVNGKVDI